jgi:quercetin dioxygenase-like cupin family protein
VSSQPSRSMGTELLFENDRIRVWDLVLEPGQELSLHHHESDYVFVVLTAGRFTVLKQDGESETMECGDGLVEYTEVGPGVIHGLRNSGQQRYREIIVELKGPSRAATPREAEDNGRYSASS